MNVFKFNGIRILFFVLVCLACFGLHAEDYSLIFGDITEAEKELSVYNQDSTADAVVLYNIGRTEFIQTDYGFDVVFTCQTRIKIFSESALEYSKIKIPLYKRNNTYEELRGVSANVYNIEDGRINTTHLSEGDIIESKVDNSWIFKKIVLPDVKAGSIIEYKYQISSNNCFEMHDWDFQWSIPVLYSRYEAHMIPFYKYTFILQGDMTSVKSGSYTDEGYVRSFRNIDFKNKVYIYEAKDVPAFKDESFITSKEDYISKIRFQLSHVYYPNGDDKAILTTWEELIKAHLKAKSCGKYIRSSKGEVKRIFGEEYKKMLDNDRFNMVVNHVKENYRWNGVRGISARQSVKQFQKTKLGSCANINLYAIGLLQGMGLDAYPIISSSRLNGKIPLDYPFADFFDNVLIGVNIDGDTIISDATSKLCANTLIPERSINDKGLIVKADEDVQWVDLHRFSPSMVKTNTMIKFDDADKALLEVELIETGLNALKTREIWKGGKDSLIERFGDQIYIDEKTYHIVSIEEKEEPVVQKFQFSQKVDIEKGKISIDPFWGQTISEVPFNSNSRSYPVDMVYKNEIHFYTKILLPENYSVAYVSENIHNENPLYAIDYSVIKDDRSLSISFSYQFKKAVYSPEDYLEIKGFFQRLVDVGSKRIILQKE